MGTRNPDCWRILLALLRRWDEEGAKRFVYIADHVALGPPSLCAAALQLREQFWAPKQAIYR